MAVKTLTGNPIIVTSADTFTTVPATDRVRIMALYWATGAAPADGNDVVVAHADGAVIWQPVLDAAFLGDRKIEFPKVFEAKGLAITPPDAGTLFVYLADSYA